MKRLLLDQGVPRDAAVILRSLGWEVIHVGEVGMAAAEDSDIIAHARAENRACVTLDADFHASLALSGASGPSVVRVRREGVGGKEMATILLELWRRHEELIDRGALATVTGQSMRIRPLPIRVRAR